MGDFEFCGYFAVDWFWVRGRIQLVGQGSLDSVNYFMDFDSEILQLFFQHPFHNHIHLLILFPIAHKSHRRQALKAMTHRLIDINKLILLFLFSLNDKLASRPGMG